MCTVRSMPSLSHLANTECPLTVKHCARCQAAFCNPGHYPSVNCLGLVPKGLSTEIGSLFLYSLILPTSCLLANLKSNLYFCLFLPFHLSNNSIVFYRIIAWGRRVFFFFFKGHLQKKLTTDTLNYLLNFTVTLMLSFTYPLN